MHRKLPKPNSRARMLIPSSLKFSMKKEYGDIEKVSLDLWTKQEEARAKYLNDLIEKTEAIENPTEEDNKFLNMLKNLKNGKQAEGEKEPIANVENVG